MVKKKKSPLNHFEKIILILINKSVAPLSVHAISKRLDISYTTAKKYVGTLEDKKLIKKYA